ncbi:MAG: hypothetical protein AAF249_12870 [Pseudomonadota bacterium]
MFSRLVVFSPLAICACEASRDECEVRIDDLSGEYVGPAIALSDGHVSFALDDNCSLLVSGDYAFHKEVKEAWEASALGNEFRAIAISVSGDITAPTSKFVPYDFHARGVASASNDVSVQDAETQFGASFGKSMNEVP